jgi:hypothetical protein
MYQLTKYGEPWNSTTTLFGFAHSTVFELIKYAPKVVLDINYVEISWVVRVELCHRVGMNSTRSFSRLARKSW